MSGGALALDLVWFVLGFIFYATLFATGGALVSRHEEVTNATSVPIVVLVVGLFLVYVVVADPGSASSVVLSLVPPWTPVLMAFRMATSDVPAWQVLLGIALLTASAIGMTQVAGRTYANSILHVGTRVRLADALRSRSSRAGPTDRTDPIDASEVPTDRK